MDVLMIIKDTNALREGTALRASILEQSKLAHRLFVIVLNRHRDHYDIQRVSESVWFIPTNSWMWWLAPFDAARLSRRELYFQGHLQIDLIAACDPCESGFAGLLLNRWYRKPLHVRIDENIFSPYYKFTSLSNILRAFVARFVVRASSRLQVATENIRASVADISDDVSDRTDLCMPFIDVQLFLKEPVRVDLHAKYPQFKYIILMVCPLSPAYNVGLALRVLAGVHKHYSHAGLVIVGEGRSKRHLRALAKLLGISDHVIIEPLSENLVSYYKTANVFLVTALYDDYNNALAHASASGCPVVSTRVGVAPSIISQGDSGFLCDPEDPGTFVVSIMKLITDPAIRARVSLNAGLYLEKNTEGGKEKYLQLITEGWERALASKGY